MKVSVAPMHGWTNRHCRYLHRLLTRHTLLYTEMIVANAVLRGDRERLLVYHPLEHPLAVQLGGHDPKQLADAAMIVADYGYDEINLNVGCPSECAQSGGFGAALYGSPRQVAACVEAMREAVEIPLTVKMRIGVDEHDSYEDLSNFVDIVSRVGCGAFIVHARKALLGRFNPKENRSIPPLCYEMVYRLKGDFPMLTFILNGGLTDVETINRYVGPLDGVMIGRAAYHNSYFLSEIDGRYYGDNHPIPSRHEVVGAYSAYVESRLGEGVPLSVLIASILGLFQGVAGARAWRRYLSEHGHLKGAGVRVISDALDAVNEGP